jgi:prepilin-type N-terminal cleavage/methylation domain-containing protein
VAAVEAERRGAQGFSMVESVVAIAILGIIVAAMVGGMATSISASDIHRQQSQTNAVMVSAAESVKSQPYSNCALTYPPGTSLPTGWPADAVSVSVKYWNAASSTWGPTCHDTDGSSFFPMQLVTVLVASPGQRATTSVGIVKRRP